MAKTFVSLALIALINFGIVNSYLVSGIIDSKGVKNFDFSNTKVVLNEGEYTGFVDNTGKFNIYVDYSGIYKLDVINLQFHFEPVVVEIIEPTDKDEGKT